MMNIYRTFRHWITLTPGARWLDAYQRGDFIRRAFET